MKLTKLVKSLTIDNIYLRTRDWKLRLSCTDSPSLSAPRLLLTPSLYDFTAFIRVPLDTEILYILNKL